MRRADLVSPEDVRAAVLMARGATVDWAGRPAASRGRTLFRLAEVMESRLEDLCATLARGGESISRAAAEAEAAIERATYYAGFCDKLQALLASRDPVPGPLLCVTYPEPMGVVAIVAPERPALLGLVSTALAAAAAGNACVVLVTNENVDTALVWVECLSTCGLPSGAIQVRTGRAIEIGPLLANHPDVATVYDATRGAGAMRGKAAQGLACIERFVRYKTLWHPAGS